MVFEHTSYRSFLKSTLAERITKNPAYSLRALAGFLELSPSQLSEVINGSKNLSYENSLRVATRLGLSKKESDYFVLLVQYETTKRLDAKDVIQKAMVELNKRRPIVNFDMDSFKVISDWYHIPIVSMIPEGGGSFDPKLAAEKLGITPLEASAAIERLERVGMVIKDSRGNFKRSHEHSVFKSEGANEGLRNFHRQMLELAIKSLSTQTTQEKFVGSETFAIDKAQLPKAKEVIEEFFDRMISLFGTGKKKTDVYHLGVQLFNLTKGRRK